MTPYTITKSDFNKICRTCLEIKQKMVSLDSDICDKLKIIANTKISESDNLPNQICSECCGKTYELYKFRKQCELSEQYLQEILGNETLCDSKTWFENTSIDKKIDVLTENKLNETQPKDEQEDTKENIFLNNPEFYDVSSTYLVDNKVDHDYEPYDDDDDQDSVNTKSNEDEFKVATNPESRTNTLSLRKARINWVMSLSVDKCDTNLLLCKICNKRLVNISSLARHMETHDTNRKFSVTCTICNRGFYEKSNYVRHMLRHKKETRYKCNQCPKSFYELNTLANHLQRCHKVESIACTKCDKKFVIEEQFRNHMRKHENQFQHLCSHCGKGYFLLRRLKEHLLTHKATYLCEICNKTYKNHSSLNKHNFRYHKRVQERQVCQICGKAVLHLKAHILIHNGARTFECEECKKSFIHRSDLVAHCKRKHRSSDEPPILPYLCNICGKRKLSNAALEQHIIHAHTTEKTQKCYMCEKRFKTDNALKSHIRYSHKDVRNFKCTVCGKGFYTNAILRNHMRTHTGERPFVCHICNRAFGKNSTLKTHMKIHSTADYNT